MSPMHIPVDAEGTHAEGMSILQVSKMGRAEREESMTRTLSPAQYQDLWPLDRGVSALRRAKQYVWKELKSLKWGSGVEEKALLEAFDLLHRLQGERWRDVVQIRYFEAQERIGSLEKLRNGRK